MVADWYVKKPALPTVSLKHLTNMAIHDTIKSIFHRLHPEELIRYTNSIRNRLNDLHS